MASRSRRDLLKTLFIANGLSLLNSTTGGAASLIGDAEA